jgi:putative membrane protein
VLLTRQAAVAIAILALGVAWLGPLPDLTARSFVAHMTLHMTVVAIASPLISAALAGSRLDPARLAPALFAAIPASLVELVVVWTWHAPVLHHAARHRPGMFIFEQASFLAAGLFFWCSVLGGDSGARRQRAGSGIIALLLTFAHMTLLGALLALTPRPLYSHADSLRTLTPLADQQLGGTIMLLLGGVSYMAGGLWLSRDLLAKRRPLMESA